MSSCHYRDCLSYRGLHLFRSSSLSFLALVAALLLATSCGGSGGSGNSGGSGGGGGTPSPTLTLAVGPAGIKASPGYTFWVTVGATVTGTTDTPTLNLGTLPKGFTANNAYPVSIPASGITLSFSADKTVAAGSYSIPFVGGVDSVTQKASVAITVPASVSPSPVQFVSKSPNETAIAPGQSATVQISTTGADYEMSLSVTGLPSGVTATVSPQMIQGASTVTVTLTASGSAPPAQNVQWAIVGTPSLDVTPPTASFLLDVTAANGVGWTNRTDYVATRATPISAAYDAAHKLIYSSNPTWNRIDVISDSTHQLVRSIPLLSPASVDISADGKTIWVTTSSQTIYGIDTGTQQMTRYQAPRFSGLLDYKPAAWYPLQMKALKNGTLLLYLSTNELAFWDPVSNTMSQLPAPLNQVSQSYIFNRSGDGSRLVVTDGAGCFTYDVASGTLMGPVTLSLGNFSGYAFHLSVNQDGSKFVLYGGSAILFDGSGNFVANLPGGGHFSPPAFIFGGFIFSPDGSTIYDEVQVGGVPLILTFDSATQQLRSTAPAMPIEPVKTEMDPPFYVPAPFAIDDSGLLLGVQYHGIAFDDPAPNIGYAFSNLPVTPEFVQVFPLSGPATGGTTTWVGGFDASQVPDVYCGPIKRTATNNVEIQFVSPAVSTPQTVSIKVLFPDGMELFDPTSFTFGTILQDAIISGSGPQGGVPASLDGFGLASYPDTDVVTVGSNQATVTTTPLQGVPLYTGEQTATYLNYTVPPGSPGWADLTDTTANGTGVLPKAFFYAKSVTDYSTTDTPTFLLYDKGRNQIYLSAGNHIDVFSLASNSYVSPIVPPTISGAASFQGLTLSNDGSQLLATNQLDGSLAIVNPDAPSTSSVIALGSAPKTSTCPLGPMFVAQAGPGQAIVASGSMGGDCMLQVGHTYVMNLSQKSVSIFNVSGCNGGGPFAVSSADGSVVNFGGGELYYTAQHTCPPEPVLTQPAVAAAAAADGNVFSCGVNFLDGSANKLGAMATPPVFFSSYMGTSPDVNGALLNPVLNASGSLYFWAYPNYIDIVDVQTGVERLRIGLTETIANTLGPIAIDENGQRIFLVTNKGLTVIDLGQAPLSVGHMSQTTASAGNTVTVRGSGFLPNTSVTLGGVSAVVTYGDESTLTIQVPSSLSGYQNLTLQNPDGMSYLLPGALDVQ